jgi:glycine/D-amino acid oxidase-like deaminating enzyme/nitrite reductase/ring-hydroxylating ferredoxin subunit
MDTTSYWIDSMSLPRFPQLDRDLKVDVVVIGAGITGVTAAYLLKNAGHSIALIERERCASIDTGHTTAHLTCVTDLRLRQLLHDFGQDHARATWEAGRAAIDQIVTNIRTEKIDCDFSWVPGYLHAPLDGDQKTEAKLLQKDAQLANDLGFAARFMERVPLVDRPGVKFLHQAKFHPRKYLAGLLCGIPGRGSHVFEFTAASEVQEKPLVVKANNRRIQCRYVILATHTPLMGKSSLLSATLLQTKLFLYTSYAIGAKIPQGTFPEALFWDTAEPYHYLRIDRHRGFDYAIFGGEDHKTGQETDTPAAFKRLEGALRRIIPKAHVGRRWSGQVIETPDGLPYMGETSSRQFVATGFGGNGMTFGTLGAMMAVDAFRKRKNPWAELFAVDRKKLKAGWDYLKENKDYPYYLVRDWIGGAEGTSLNALKRNEGKILRLGGKKVAAFRNEQGNVSLCSPVCTHLKCIVAWNKAERTWDCPCHGSRFKATGEVIAGPAEQDLEKLPLPGDK